MSSILFHFADGITLPVSGSERAHFALMAEDFSRGLLGLAGDIPSNLADHVGPFINPLSSMASVPPNTVEWDSAMAYAISTIGLTGVGVFAWRGQEIDMSSLVWNTVLAAGSDPMRLGVKIHCTCESYGYIMGFHRKWFADIIDEGLEEGLFRRGYHRYKNPLYDLDLMRGRPVPEDAEVTVISQGWPELAAKLREENVGPVVMSFSGGDSFLNALLGSWMPPWPEGTPRHWDSLTRAQQEERSNRQEEWHTLPFSRQWAISVKGLKTTSKNPAIDPKNLRTWRFHHGISLLDLMSQDIERIEKGLAGR